MACRNGIVKLARVVQAMVASLGLLQALKFYFYFTTYEKDLLLRMGAAKTTAESKATAGDPLLQHEP